MEDDDSVDYQAVNNATVPNKFSIPNIEELLDELNEATYFAKIDIEASYHHIKMHEHDVLKQPSKLTKDIVGLQLCHLGRVNKCPEPLSNAL